MGLRHGRSWEGWDDVPAGGPASPASFCRSQWAGCAALVCVSATQGRGGGQRSGAQGSTAACRVTRLPPPLLPALCSFLNPKRSDNTGTGHYTTVISEAAGIRERDVQRAAEAVTTPIHLLGIGA